MQYYVYILSSYSNSTIYVGVTNDLRRRIYEHKNNLHPDSFTAKYNIHKLVYYEETSDVLSAIEREKQLKDLSRKKKDLIISAFNPAWNDLYNSICE